MPNGGADDPRGQEPRRAKDEGHAQGRLVGEDAVRRLAVLSERLAVVGGEDDEDPLARARREERLEERPQGGIRRRHLALVGLGGESSTRAGREARTGSAARTGGRRRTTSGRGRNRSTAAPRAPSRCPASRASRRRGRLRSPQPVVVDVEAPVEAEPGVERERADEGPGAPAPLAEDRGEGGPVGREAEARVVADAVAQGVLAGEQVGVGGQGHDVVRPGRLEADALGREAVDPRRPRVARGRSSRARPRGECRRRRSGR